MATSPLHGLLETMHTAFGQPCLVGKTAHTLRAVVTKTLEHAQAFVPKSHVGLYSAGGLNSWPHSVLQRTWPTPNCPALNGYPALLFISGSRLPKARRPTASAPNWK